MSSTGSSIPDVLQSVERVVGCARHVSIDEDAVRRWAGALATQARVAVAEPDELVFVGDRADCAQYALITDALNFCFWSDEPWEVEYRGRMWTRTFAMMAGVLRAIEQDRTWLTADRWADATEADVDTMFAGRGCIPLRGRRLAILRETGSVLLKQFDGQFVRAVEAVESDARALAYLLADRFESFRDVAMYDGERVAILKRAQICAADLHRLWLANGHEGLGNLEALTVFADYRLPQLFRHEGMMQLAKPLANRIDNGEAIEAGSAEEVEIRAATIWIAALLCDALEQIGKPEAAWQLDYELWVRARKPDVTVPHHRTLTHYY